MPRPRAAESSGSEGSVPSRENTDERVVVGFGEEWIRFRHEIDPDDESRLRAYESYFACFPWDRLQPGARGFDLGCGTGRWAYFTAQRCGSLLLVDASEEALGVARHNLRSIDNVEFLCASAGDLPLPDQSFDFGYSLGVLHHTPQPLIGLSDAVRLLRPGAPILVYLYYALDNRGPLYRALWRLSDLPRRGISRLPARLRFGASDLIAAVIYWPLARLARLVERFGGPADSIPLSAYRHKSFYVMRTDALDRFGTRLELRFTKAEIVDLMTAAGLVDIVVSDEPPYWCAVGFAPDAAS